MTKIPQGWKALLRMFSRVALAAWIGAFSAGCQSLPTRGATDLDRLQGLWQGRGPGGDCSVVIEGYSLIYTQPPAEEGQEGFRYETIFTLPEEVTGPKQLHATIIGNNSPDQPHIGTVVVNLFELEEPRLTLGVIEHSTEPPTDPIVGDWEDARDVFHLEKSTPR